MYGSDWTTKTTHTLIKINVAKIYAKRILYLTVRFASHSCHPFSHAEALSTKVNNLSYNTHFAYLLSLSGILIYFFLFISIIIIIICINLLASKNEKPITFVEQCLMHANNNKQSVCKFGLISVFLIVLRDASNPIVVENHSCVVAHWRSCTKPCCDAISHFKKVSVNVQDETCNACTIYFD